MMMLLHIVVLMALFFHLVICLSSPTRMLYPHKPCHFVSIIPLIRVNQTPLAWTRLALSNRTMIDHTGKEGIIITSKFRWLLAISLRRTHFYFYLRYNIYTSRCVTTVRSDSTRHPWLERGWLSQVEPWSIIWGKKVFSSLRIGDGRILTLIILHTLATY